MFIDQMQSEKKSEGYKNRNVIWLKKIISKQECEKMQGC